MILLVQYQIKEKFSICFDTNSLNIYVVSYKFVNKAEATRAPVQRECIKKLNEYLLGLLKLKHDNI